MSNTRAIDGSRTSPSPRLAMVQAFALRFCSRELLLGALALLLGCMLMNCSLADDRVLNKKAGKSASLSQGNKLVLQFKVSPIVDSQEVRLGDLVEIVSLGERGSDDLLAFLLSPAPQVGRYQDWTAEDLIRHLEYRGVNRSRIAWQGPESVRLMRKRPGTSNEKVTQAASRQLAPAFLNERVVTQAESNLVQATREYLWMQTNERTSWRIALKVPPELADSLAQRRNILSIGGGEEPWTGRQRFVYLVKHKGEELELTMTVSVELPTEIVVASRAIRRDEVIDESCLTMAPLPERLEGQVDAYFLSASELIGKQVRRAISTGVPIGREFVGEPNVIASGELVEIESVSGAVVVKSAAKALSGGAVGDLINVELVPGRKRLVARVVDAGLVRITGKAAVPSEPEENAAAQLSRSPAHSKTARNVAAKGELR